eukprot:3617632-Amphidinium_carterae.1
MEQFAGDELCCRLVCRHLFHSSCYERYSLHHVQRSPQPASAQPDCPNCRGSGRITATFRYIAAVDIHTPPPTHRAASAEFHTPAAHEDSPVSSPSTMPPAFAWWPLESVYNVHTAAAGEHGLLIDPGSYGNLVGSEWITAVEQKAKAAGLSVTFQRRAQPLRVG